METFSVETVTGPPDTSLPPLECKLFRGAGTGISNKHQSIFSKRAAGNSYVPLSELRLRDGVGGDN